MRKVTLTQLRDIRIGTRWRDFAAVSLIVATFSWICYRHLDQPGPYGDETWAASFAILFLRGKDLPFMPSDYIGPISVYFLAGFFAVFGISLSVMRVATSLVGLLGILATYLLLKREFGRLAAVTTSLFLATDLTYVLAMRHDWGVISFGLLARMLALYFFLSWWRARKRLGFLFLSFLVLGLSLTYRFDYLSFVVSALVGVVLFYILWLSPRLKAREALTGLAGLTTGALPILLYNISTGGQTFRQARTIAVGKGVSSLPTNFVQLWPFLQTLPASIVSRANDLFLMTRGTYVANWITGERVELFSRFGESRLPSALKIASPVLLAVIFLPRFRSWRRPFGFLVTVFALTLLFLAATPIATGPHHILSVYPLPHIMVGVALAGLWRIWHERPKPLVWISRLTVVAAIGMVIIPNLFLAQTFHTRLVSQGGNGYWSEAIYDLSEAMKHEYAGKTLVLVDWGFEQPLDVLGQGKFDLQPVFWRILAEEDPGPWLTTMIRNPQAVFAIRSDKFTWNAAIKKRFQDVYLKQQDLVVEERKFYQKNGEHVFSVLRFHAP